MTIEQIDTNASFDIDDILKEIADKENNKSEVTAYLDRDFFEGMIAEYYENMPKNISSIFALTQVNINEYNFTGTDFRGISKKDFDIFDFTNCDISSCHIDKDGIEFFKPYIRKQKIKYVGLSLEGANLSPKLYISNLGIITKIITNLSDLDLSGVNFRNCNLEKVNFKGTDINMADFSGSINMSPIQFANAYNFDNAMFYNDVNEDREFKIAITKMSKEKKDLNKPYYNRTHHVIASLFDEPDSVRFDE